MKTTSLPQHIPLFLLAQTMTPPVKPWQPPDPPTQSAFPIEDFLALLFQRRNNRTRTHLS